ncbi:hypothetical protein BDD12DRAFT_903890 [Trichophaea hybrida]|nr:hypothetical protein BDD12DRAFT_903890 [Trichophaea hybrida]
MRIPHILIAVLFSPTTLAFPRTLSKRADPCASLATQLNQTDTVPATDALNCLKSVPFSKPEALDLISNLRLYTNFIPSQGYYPNPINPALGIPAFNINSTIDKIESRAKNGQYKNGFDFWREVSLAYTGFRDGHMTFQPTCGGRAFSWYHDYPIVAVNGTEIYTMFIPPRNTSTPIPARLEKKVTKINGQDSVQFLLEMSKTMPDLYLYLDEDVRWNGLMTSYPSNRGFFANRTLWAGEEEETLRLTFEGGEEVPVEWKAIYTAPGLFTDTTSFAAAVCYLHPDLYKFQSPKVAGPLWKKDPTGDTYSSQLSSVLSKIASSTGVPTATTSPITTTTPTNAPSSTITDFPTSTTSLRGYPTPLYRGPDDTLLFFPDPDNSPTLAVLRIPTFTVFQNATAAWNSFLNATLTTLGTSGVTKLLIDVSNNPGGNANLPKRVLRMLFPTTVSSIPGTEPEYEFEWRYHTAMAKMLRAPTDRFTVQFNDRRVVNRTGGNFSVDEVVGPYFDPKPRDYFTVRGIPRTDLLTAADEGRFPRRGVFAKEDVVVVSNGQCSSSCHFLVEFLMQFGVRSYVLGGAGAREDPGGWGDEDVGLMVVLVAYDECADINSGVIVEYEDLVYESYIMFGDTTDQKDIPKFPVTQYERASVSLENTFRLGDDVPLFFRYTPACRKIPVTKSMATDIREVWREVKRVAWGDGAMECDR